MKDDMEEWGNSVTEKLDGTTPPSYWRTLAWPSPPRPMKNIELTVPLATYNDLEQVKLQLAQTIDGKIHSTANLLILNTFNSNTC